MFVFYTSLIYEFSRSVHNIRIERLWVDVTQGFGKKWKDFFHLLEVYHGLNVDNPLHLWLLHFLFLSRINHDAEVWSDSWNHHVLSSRTHTHQTPLDMYRYGIMENGVRGVFPTDDQVSEDGSSDNDYADFGVFHYSPVILDLIFL